MLIAASLASGLELAHAHALALAHSYALGHALLPLAPTLAA
ncbi:MULTISPECIES: hypothetical protein [unclassified Prochlorococcus]|nr:MULTISPECIES: hypothetical protein [unclassified Prochlorococcus]KGG28872.1 hypothetical protein EV12_0501 [Prochlorococcus sp. MIT 0701]KGG29660.1 hypothetical protein EV13_0877 [Prochlorococcus sp. MIT 0702]KGG34215.1 hypothetical protein EV14_1309 [Prochlorococcus sp. MIT 0703]